MTRTRAWCFWVHRWWTEMVPPLPGSAVWQCTRCGELWNRP